MFYNTGVKSVENTIWQRAEYRIYQNWIAEKTTIRKLNKTSTLAFIGTNDVILKILFLFCFTILS
jgi:hypothetical protein